MPRHSIAGTRESCNSTRKQSLGRLRYETEDDGDGRFRSVILCNDKTKQVEGFIVKRDGTAVPFDARTVPFDAKTLAATKEQIDAVVNFWSETLGKGASRDKFLEAAKALQEKLRDPRDSEKKKAKFSVFVTTPCRGLSPSR